MRQIVAGLTGDAEGCTDLASELSRGDPVTLEIQDSDDEGNDPEDWTPDPTDAVPGQRTQRPWRLVVTSLPEKSPSNISVLFSRQDGLQATLL